MQVGDSGGGFIRELVVVGTLGLTAVLGVVGAGLLIEQEQPPPPAKVQWTILRGPPGGDDIGTACVDGWRLWETISGNAQLEVLRDPDCVNE